LAGARRPAEQDVVTAGCCELERPPGPLLPADVGEIRRYSRAVPVRRDRLLWLQLELATQVGSRLCEVPDRNRGNAGERRLARGIRRTEESFRAEPPGALGDCENAAHAPQPAVERELPEGGGALERA